MDAMRDPGTLEVEVVQDWHTVQGPIVTRQKLVTINVGEIWPFLSYMSRPDPNLPLKADATVTPPSVKAREMQPHLTDTT